MLAVLMPNSSTFFALVETATKWLATALSSSPNPCSSQSRALWALVMVSSVESLDETMKERFRGGRVAGGFDKINPIHVGNEPEDHNALV